MKALALLSGGLDSTLAAKLMQEQGIEVVSLNLKTPFCLCDRKTSQGCIHTALTAATTLGLSLKVINISAEFFEVVKKPKYGFGSNMNPCIDCRILKFKKSKEFMQEVGAHFVFTGEVLGQRPMSQHRRALAIIEKESGLEGLVLRPLSAKLLPETIPEKEGWVDRNKLLGFSGRSRRPQFDLARIFNIKDYPCPAGGCLLTDPEFSKRMKDLLLHGRIDLNNVNLLKVGRHFRLSQASKLIVGRNENENYRIIQLAQDGDYLFEPRTNAGPTALGRGIFDEGLVQLAGAIVSSYCDRPDTAQSEISVHLLPLKEERFFCASILTKDALAKLRI